MKLNIKFARIQRYHITANHKPHPGRKQSREREGARHNYCNEKTLHYEHHVLSYQLNRQTLKCRNLPPATPCVSRAHKALLAEFPSSSRYQAHESNTLSQARRLVRHPPLVCAPLLVCLPSSSPATFNAKSNMVVGHEGHQQGKDSQQKEKQEKKKRTIKDGPAEAIRSAISPRQSGPVPSIPGFVLLL